MPRSSPTLLIGPHPSLVLDAPRGFGRSCLMAEDKIRHIVVLGAGFGGLTFCRHFQHPTARITLVDRTNHHLFQPLLYQVATAGLSAPEIAQPIRGILSDRPNVTVMM